MKNNSVMDELRSNESVSSAATSTSEQRVSVEDSRPPVNNRKHYVVWVGVQPGIYDNWTDAEKQVKRYSGAKFKSYPSYAEAETAFKEWNETNRASTSDKAPI